MFTGCQIYNSVPDFSLRCCPGFQLAWNCYSDIYVMYQTQHLQRVILILAQDPSTPAFLNPVPDSFIHGIVHAHSFSSLRFLTLQIQTDKSKGYITSFIKIHL